MIRRAGAQVIAVLIVLSGPVAAQTVRFDWPDPNTQLIGYLTSNGGVGGIAWEEGVKTESNLGTVPTSEQDQQYKLAMDTYALTGQLLAGRAVQPPMEFKSAPIARTIHLDPRRAIEVDLALSRYSSPYNDPCASTTYSYVALSVGGAFADPWLTVEVKVDGKTIAGHWRGSSISWYPWNGFYPPPSPPGYATCRFRFHAQATDIASGSTISLLVTPLIHSKGFQIGTGDDHRSFLRITPFTDEDWVFRNPASAATQAGGGAGGSGGEEAAAVLLVPLAGLVLAPRRQRRSLMLGAVLLAGALAGCLGGDAGTGAQGDSGPQGKVTNTLIADKDRTITTKGNGSIVGQVIDEFNLPLAGVHVGILGTDFFAESGKGGQFSFHDLPPAIYRLRLDKKDFKSFETEVEVKAGFISRPQITLLPLVEKEGDETRHKHDYWAGETTKTLIDGPISWYFSIPPADAGYNSVLPGTYLMEAKISWAATARHQQVALLMRTNLEPAAYNYTVVGLIKNGETAKIPVTWEMSDPGHQTFSSWNFQLEADPRVSKSVPGPPFCFLICASASVDPAPQYSMKLVIHRGAVPLEPAHPDHWAGTDRKPVFAGTWTSTHGSSQTQYALQSCMPDKACYYNTAYFGGTVGLVPFDATWLEVYMNKTQEPSTSYNYNLKFTTASKTAGQQTAQKPIRSGLSTRYTIPLETSWADPTYAAKGAWSFMAMPDNQAAANQDTANPVAPNYGLGLMVIAHKGPVPG